MERLQELIERLDPNRIPRHVAIIMDGNGRWAQRQSLERTAGHFEGVGTVHRITEIASDIGVKYLTLYAFSTENWNRPKEEVDTLMDLIGQAIVREVPEMLEKQVKLNLIGDLERLPRETRENLLESERVTSKCTGLTMSTCLSYSSRWEIMESVRKMARDIEMGIIKPDDITEKMFADSLSTYPLPDPDLLIRTGGELRISNFLLWQIAYSELYFTPCLWPDFGKEEFVEAIIDFQNRQRRFGMTGEQVTEKPTV